VPCRLLLVPGSLRATSTNVAVLRTASRLVPPEVDAVLYERLGELPHFNPDDDGGELHREVASLRDAIHVADALMFSTPEYAGALPGSFKNLLDWTIGDDRPGSIYDKPVAWINASPRGAEAAHDELRRVLGYAHAGIVDAACIRTPVTGSMIGDDGLIADATTRGDIALALAILASAVPSCARSAEVG
jgi:NAD(P)H-dependent FMN reductase